MKTDELYPVIGSVQDGGESRVGGLTVITAAVFIVGEMAGSGVLALPSAVSGAGWIGFLLIPLCCVVSAYTGDVLGRCWGMAQDRYDHLKGHVRYPYPAIGEIAFGKPGRLLVSFSINFTLFGVSVVFLLLASQNIQDLISNLHKDISFCYWLLIVAAVLTPLSWLGTPKDFWPIAVGATCATAIACIVLFADMLNDHSRHPETIVEHKNPSFTSFFTAFGTICFAFGGHPAFPTFQADMKEPKKFGKVVTIAYLIVLCMYLPVAAGGYYAYGKNVGDNVLTNLPPGTMLYIVEILITLHLVCSYVIVINPFCQEIEHVVRIPEEFTWKRCVFRTLITGVILFVAESIPHFGAILSLVGGSTTTLLAYILPPLFYLKLCSMQGEWDDVFVPLHVKVFNFEIMAIGLVAGIASTYAAVSSLASPGSFTVPCYVNLTAAKG